MIFEDKEEKSSEEYYLPPLQENFPRRRCEASRAGSWRANRIRSTQLQLQFTFIINEMSRIPLLMHVNPKLVKDSPVIILLTGKYKFDSDLKDSIINFSMNGRVIQINEYINADTEIVISDKTSVKAAIVQVGTEKELSLYLRKLP